VVDSLETSPDLIRDQNTPTVSSQRPSTYRVQCAY
jgi:hypothetical protein